MLALGRLCCIGPDVQIDNSWQHSTCPGDGAVGQGQLTFEFNHNSGFVPQHSR